MDILLASFLVKSPTKSVSKAYRWTFHSNPTAANMAAGVLNRARQRTGGSRWGGGLEVRWWKLWVLKMLDDMQKREGFMMISLETLEFLGLEGLDPLNDTLAMLADTDDTDFCVQVSWIWAWRSYRGSSRTLHQLPKCVERYQKVKSINFSSNSLRKNNWVMYHH